MDPRPDEEPNGYHVGNDQAAYCTLENSNIIKLILHSDKINFVPCEQCDQIGRFLKVLGKKLLTKVAQKDW